ncbi:MAG TPA: hypothetical protein VMT53_19335 [Terriglobales bacterium]|nr:hypothetical protein [Terriglobales bacterium]
MKIMVIYPLLLLSGMSSAEWLYPSNQLPAGTHVTAAGASSSCSSVSCFSYRREAIETGLVYHYIKSNLDGSNATRVAIYVQSPTHVEVLKIYPGVPYAFNVTADMDWTRFEPDHYMQWLIHRDGSRELQMSLEEQPDGRSLRLKAAGDAPVPATVMEIPIGDHPAHIYSFDFISLNFALRHLSNPEGQFQVGIVAPDPKEPKLVYKGLATVQYLKDEPRHQVSCRVYRVSGPGLDNTEGKIWVNKKAAHIEDMEFSLPDVPAWDAPGWNSFKFELKSMEPMDDFRWNQWMLDQAKAIK